MADFTFDITDVPDVPDTALVRLNGIIDVTTAETFRGLLGALVGEGIRCLILDCARLEFINSTGFAVVVDAATRTMDLGGKVVLTRLRSSIEDLAVGLGLDVFFGIEPSNTSAIRCLQNLDSAIPTEGLPPRDVSSGSGNTGSMPSPNGSEAPFPTRQSSED